MKLVARGTYTLWRSYEGGDSYPRDSSGKVALPDAMRDEV